MPAASDSVAVRLPRTYDVELLQRDLNTLQEVRRNCDWLCKFALSSAVALVAGWGLDPSSAAVSIGNPKLKTRICRLVFYCLGTFALRRATTDRKSVV